MSRYTVAMNNSRLAQEHPYSIHKDSVVIARFKWAEDALAYVEHCETVESFNAQRAAQYGLTVEQYDEVKAGEELVPERMCAPFTVNSMVECGSCEGTGKEADNGCYHECTTCGGKGHYPAPKPVGLGMTYGQLAWAKQHDWYVSCEVVGTDSAHTAPLYKVTVRDFQNAERTRLTTFANYEKLRNWAGY